MEENLTQEIHLGQLFWIGKVASNYPFWSERYYDLCIRWKF